jgi:MYXO-CTERM domain-containing protein
MFDPAASMPASCGTRHGNPRPGWPWRWALVALVALAVAACEPAPENPEQDATRTEGRAERFRALAVYNVGWGHLRAARRLARERGMNPDQWRHLKEVLPLLSKPEIAAKLPYGYARGTEPVRYVRRIREYRHIIKRHLE